MGVGDAADTGKAAVEFEMRRVVGGRAQVAVDNVAIEVGDNDVGSGEIFVGDAAGFDGYQSLLAINSAGVAEGVKDKAAPNQFEVRL